MSGWFHIEIERVFAVDRGVDAILCTRQIGNEIVVRMSDDAIKKLRHELAALPSIAGQFNKESP